MSGQFAAAPNSFSPTGTFVRDEPEFTPEPTDEAFEIDSNGSSEESMFGTTPIYARAAARKNSGPSKAILLGVPAALVAAGAVAYFAMQPRNDLIAEASSPEPASAPVLTPPIPPAPEPQQMAADEAAPLLVDPTPQERVTGSVQAAAPPRPAPVRVARARPAQAAPSVEGSAQDASAVLPAAPVPYSATTAGGASTAPIVSAIPNTATAPTGVAPTQPAPVAPAEAASVNPDPTAPSTSAIP